jgi:hypothetical protein
MFAWLRSLISAAAVIELHSSRIRVRDISGGPTFEFEPILSIDDSQRVVSVGRPISASAVKTYAPFESPSSLANELHIAKLILQFAYSKLGAVAWLKPAPRIVLSIRRDNTNGVHLLGDDALAELSTSAGARTTVIYRGRPLSDDEALRLLDAA